jgi:membrane protein
MDSSSQTGFFRRKINYLVEKAKEVSLPGFDKVPIYDVTVFFLRGFQKGALVTRASAIAFNLLFAILPSTIFLFTLIPYIPIEGFQTEVLEMLKMILPENVYNFLESSLVDLITNKSAGLLIIMFGATVILSSNGVHALFSAFNVSSHDFEMKTWFDHRSISVMLVFLITMLMTTAVMVFILSQNGIQQLVEMKVIETNTMFYAVKFGKWVILILMLFTIISMIYYFAPSKKSKWNFITPGSILATLMFFISSSAFSYFVNHFGRFNKLYGSIGTLIVILIWLYFNSISLLIGFELNASIKSANRNNNINET